MLEEEIVMAKDIGNYAGKRVAIVGYRAASKGVTKRDHPLGGRRIQEFIAAVKKGCAQYNTDGG